MRCQFCVVPRKEGKVRQVAKLSDFVKRGQNKVILLDDNLLAYEGAEEILEEIIQKKYQVNFNQTLDMRHITPENAPLLRSVDSRNIKFTSKV